MPRRSSSSFCSWTIIGLSRWSFGSDWERRIRKPFQLEWDAIVEAARESRASGQLSTTVADDADMLGVNHFYNLFESNLDLLFPPAAGQTKSDRKRERDSDSALGKDH